MLGLGEIQPMAQIRQTLLSRFSVLAEIVIQEVPVKD
jgi:hypothetical protein